MAKKPRRNGEAAAKRAKAEKILRSKPQLGKKKRTLKAVNTGRDGGDSSVAFDSATELCESNFQVKENFDAVNIEVPEDELANEGASSAQSVLWAWRSLPDDERESLARAFSHDERARILRDIAKANEWEFEKILFGGSLKSSFGNVNKWLSNHEGIGGEMTDEEKEILIQALQYFRDKYKSTFIYKKDGQPIHCTLTIGTQSGDYPKRFRVQATGRSQKVLTQRNKLPLLRLEKI